MSLTVVLAATSTIVGAIGAMAALIAAVSAFYIGIRKGNLEQRMAIDVRSAKLEERDAKFIDQMEATIKELREVSEQRRQQIRQMDTDIAGYRAQIWAREEEIATLKATMRTRDQEVIQCRERLASVEAQHLDDARRITDLEAAIRVLRLTLLGPMPPARLPTIAELQEQLERLRRGDPPAVEP